MGKDKVFIFHKTWLRIGRPKALRTSERYKNKPVKNCLVGLNFQWVYIYYTWLNAVPRLMWFTLTMYLVSFITALSIYLPSVTLPDTYIISISIFLVSVYVIGITQYFIEKHAIKILKLFLCDGGREYPLVTYLYPVAFTNRDGIYIYTYLINGRLLDLKTGKVRLESSDVPYTEDIYRETVELNSNLVNRYILKYVGLKIKELK